MTRDGSKTTLVAKKTIWWNLANLKNPSVSSIRVFSLHPVSGGVDPIINHMVFTNVPMAKSHEILSKPAILQGGTAKFSHYMVVAQKNTPTNHYTGCITKKPHESRIPSKKKAPDQHSNKSDHQAPPVSGPTQKHSHKTTSENNFIYITKWVPKKQLLSRLT